MLQRQQKLSKCAKGREIVSVLTVAIGHFRVAIHIGIGTWIFSGLSADTDTLLFYLSNREITT